MSGTRGWGIEGTLTFSKYYSYFFFLIFFNSLFSLSLFCLSFLHSWFPCCSCPALTPLHFSSCLPIGPQMLSHKSICLSFYPVFSLYMFILSVKSQKCSNTLLHIDKTSMLMALLIQQTWNNPNHNTFHPLYPQL